MVFTVLRHLHSLPNIIGKSIYHEKEIHGIVYITCMYQYFPSHRLQNWHNSSQCYKNHRIQTKLPHLNGYWAASNWFRLKASICFNFNEHILWSKYCKNSLPSKLPWVNQNLNSYLLCMITVPWYCIYS